MGITGTRHRGGFPFVCGPFGSTWKTVGDVLHQSQMATPGSRSHMSICSTSTREKKFTPGSLDPFLVEKAKCPRRGTRTQSFGFSIPSLSQDQTRGGLIRRVHFIVSCRAARTDAAGQPRHQDMVIGIQYYWTLSSLLSGTYTVSNQRVPLRSVSRRAIGKIAPWRL